MATFSLYSPSTAPFVPELGGTLLAIFGVLCGISAYLALLLAWLPSKAGPVRRFLAALLPAVTLFLVASVMGQFASLIDVPARTN